ncbi:hypothetical protein [Rhabdochromatium marinum]|uniref:hypothetical protein n=1 Tax=Rhabdochromatium marinum TaxID=48729 RepID=UPI001904B6E0|nr:hypothetical protein [Rhabdochromatium marinum]MBK1648982.1 hypothetical protein [Rhabdochromatium marinum]
MPLHTGRLLFAPENPTEAPPWEPLRAALSEAGLLGETLPPERLQAAASGTLGYAPGAHFFDYVAFTGCAVNLNTADATTGSLGCHLRLNPPCPESHFLHGRNSRPPRCPNCRKPLTDWSASLQQGRWQAQAPLRCAACGQSHPAWQWDWRRQAGFARLTLTIEEVFPGEATPLPPLLLLLQQASGGLSWQWFAVQD